MKRVAIAVLLLAGFGAPAGAESALSWVWGGHVAVPVGRFYFETPEGHREGNVAALRLAPELTVRWGDTQLLAAPDLRWENHDSGRSRADFNELSLSTRWGETTITAGITRLFWGVVESFHLENVINPPDLAADYRGETTLGLPLVRLARPLNFGPATPGQIELIWAPWDRDPAWPGVAGRPRTDLPVEAVVHPDGRPSAGAVRLAFGGSAYDAHLYYFRGLDRQAVLIPYFPDGGVPTFLYASRKKIGQFGGDLQVPVGNLLIKAEAIYRTGYSRGFAAVIAGGEYTLNSFRGTASDLGLMFEYQYDDRPLDAPLAPMKEGVYVGVRIARNDPASTELKLGVLQSTDTAAQVWRGDVSRRIAERWTIEGSLNVFANVRDEPALVGFARDSYLELSLKYYFQ